MGLIFSLFDVASSKDVPFYQLMYITICYHGLSFVLFCVPAFSAEEVINSGDSIPLALL